MECGVWCGVCGVYEGCVHVLCVVCVGCEVHVCPVYSGVYADTCTHTYTKYKWTGSRQEVNGCVLSWMLGPGQPHP
jgi:hypothetical protein